MGIPVASAPTPPAGDAANMVIQNTFTATGTSAAGAFYGPFNFAAWGTFAGTITLQKTYDGGTTYIPVVNINAGTVTAVGLTAAGSIVLNEPEKGVGYILNCTSLASGTLHARASQSGILNLTDTP